ncbi:MAG: DNA-processing protein DprA [Betaproteobacteria bacterium]
MTQDPGLAAWLRLSLTPGIGPAALRGLLAKYGLPEAVLARRRGELAQLAPSGALEAMHSAAVDRAVERALEWASGEGCAVVTLADDTYPRALLEIADPPALLYVRGRVELLRWPALAIVGSRNATAQGEANATAFATALSDAGLTIVSGLALGIDAAAHRGGLAGASSTIAVLGTGIDVVYPRANAELAARIARAGLLVSEFALGTPAAQHHFPRRNRLISGLARGCLVVEAAIASGSLITARSAADQGREVFAVPGSIHSPLAKGCHALIKSGAKLAESADDVLGELSGVHPSTRSAPAATRAREERGLLAHMGHDPVDIDLLCQRAGLSAEQVSAELLRLELDGRVSALPGGFYQVLSKPLAS